MPCTPHGGRQAGGEASLPAAGPLGTRSAAINTHLPGLTDHEAPFCSGFVCLPLMHVFRSDPVLVWPLPTRTAVFQAGSRCGGDTLGHVPGCSARPPTESPLLPRATAPPVGSQASAQSDAGRPGRLARGAGWRWCRAMSPEGGSQRGDHRGARAAPACRGSRGPGTARRERGPGCPGGRGGRSCPGQGSAWAHSRSCPFPHLFAVKQAESIDL